MEPIKTAARDDDSVSKYVRQAGEIFKSAPLRQWPSILLYMLEVVAYRISGKRLRKMLSLNLYGLNFVIKTHNMDLGVIYEIFSEGIYTTKPEFIPQDGWTCVDVGANIGCVSLVWAQRDPHGKIYAIEPHPATFGRLELNVKANNFLNVSCFNIAADRQSGLLEFVVSDQTSMGMAAGHEVDAVHPDASVSLCQVPARSLDDFFDEQKIGTADLLKIDIEGHEVACLRGSTRVLQRTRRLILEHHSPALHKECRHILIEAGFSLEESGLLIFATNTRI